MKARGFVAAGVIGLALVVSAVSSGPAQEEERIEFPANYAEDFTLYLEADRVQNHGQVMRIFANDIALQGPDEEGRLPEGSILVGEIYGAKKDDAGNFITSQLNRQIRGNLAAIGVMEKQAGWGEAFPDDLRNGDWDFAIFSPAGERLDRDLNECRACHAPLADNDHVFSAEHLPSP